MQTLSQPSSKPSENNAPTWLPWSYLVVSFLAFLDAGYLTAHHYLGTPLVCSVLQGCEQVTSSAYSTVLGVPVALLGALYYLFILLLTIWYFDRHRVSVLNFIGRITILGLLASIWFVYVQVALLHSFCLYCLFSAFTSTTLFVTSLVARSRLNR